jgi:mono/diheme cytochrome c family protein
MNWREFLAGFVVVLIIAFGAALAWCMLPPRAMSFAIGRSVTLAVYRGPSPMGVPAELSQASLAEHGKYLADAANCAACHTAVDGRPDVGGRTFRTPFGTLYSPDITADIETGIGAWSDADFLRAVHEGVAKDGSRLYPAFPYKSYTLLADDNVPAIKAYLFSLPPAHAASPPDALNFPFNQR